MGGGDLNSKKSWHPNTMKNQERVWKAEQASVEEKKRIAELQRERVEERDRAELNQLAQRTAGAASDNRLHWMYDKPDKKVQQEDFLLGKAIDSNFDADKTEQQDYIPAVARRVVGSSMLATTGNTQVDLARKMREDPLMLVKERERAARAALLNNPLQRRRLTELLRKEQEERNQRKDKKKPKKDKDLDNKLAAKLTALGEKQIDLATLLASNDSSSDSSSEDEETKSKKKHNKSKKYKKEKKSKKRHASDAGSSSEDSGRPPNKQHAEKASKTKGEGRTSSKRGGHSDSDNEQSIKRYWSNEGSESRSNKYARRNADERRGRRSVERGHRPHGRASPPGRGEARRSEERKHRPQERRPHKPDERGCKNKSGMSEEERAAKLAEMAQAGAARELERGRRVGEARAADAAAERAAAAPRPRAGRTQAHALPDSLESRIHSNRHYIQRDRTHMDTHFARR